MLKLTTLITALLLSSHLFSSQIQPAQRETLLVGVFPEDYPPLYWHDERKGIIEKLLDKISSTSRFDFTFERAPFNRLIHKVATSRIDIEPWTSEAWRSRVASKVYFTTPYARHCEVLVYNKDNIFSVNTAADLTGKRLGVVKGYTFNSFTELFSNKSIYRVNSSSEERVLNLLSHRRTDVALIDQLIAAHLFKTKYPNQFVTGNQFDCVPVSFMLSKTKIKQAIEISEILQKLKKEGFIDQLLIEVKAQD